VNRVSQAVRLDFCRFSWKKAARQTLAKLRQGRSPDMRMFLPLLTGRKQRMTVRGALTGRDGRFLHDFGEIGSWGAGETLEININELCEARGIAVDDAMFMMIMNLGEHTDALSDINIFSMSYEGDRFFTNYRTGAFARTLNDFSKKKHVGFMSINPKAVVSESHLTGLLLINHSSNPEYGDSVYPTVRLYRPDGKFLDADFGPVPAFGGIERSIEDLFGDSVRQFLEPSGGLGTTVTRVKGYTLAGITVLRSRDGGSMAIEHTRPTQSYLLNGI
jgi:hypothetical protein